ncbi:MAG: MFS transporter [Paludibacter sp.]|nr:MFS transporter [Paludibacter sp.]
MKYNTKHLTSVLSITLGMRLFSMSIIIPFLSSYALNLKDGAPWLTGYALGIFGLTQAALQIPFGALSDRIGYKKMMIAGLVMLIAGLLTAAYASNIYWLIFARALQGSGAIVTVGYSWISSASTDENRDHNLARLGAIIGFFTMLSYTIGPLVHIVLSVGEMFVFSAVLIFICLLWVAFGTKQVKPEVRKQYSNKNSQQKTVFNRRNLTMGFMLTINNLLLMTFFFMLPLLLQNVLQTNKMWIVLTPGILVAILLLKVSTKIASRGGNIRLLITLLMLMQGLGFAFIYFRGIATVAIGTVLLMTGSFSLSTVMPMLLNKKVGEGQRGKSNGVLVSLQYFGSFLGAAITGSLWNISPDWAFVFAGIMMLVGIFLIRTFSITDGIS